MVLVITFLAPGLICTVLGNPPVYNYLSFLRDTIATKLVSANLQVIWIPMCDIFIGGWIKDDIFLAMEGDK